MDVSVTLLIFATQRVTPASYIIYYLIIFIMKKFLLVFLLLATLGITAVNAMRYLFEDGTSMYGPGPDYFEFGVDWGHWMWEMGIVDYDYNP